MKWLGFREVPIASINITAEILARTEEPHVAALAASFDEATGGEPGNVPWVSETKARYSVRAGRDRVAAVLLKKSPSLWVRVGVFKTARDLLLAEVHENLHRRPDDRDALLARLVETAQVDQAGPLHDASPQTRKAAARAQVAAEVGSTPKAVKAAEHRHKTREEGAAQATPRLSGAATPPPPIETWGIEIPIALDADVTAIQLALDEADNHLQAAQRALKKLEGRPFGEALRQRLYGDVQRAGAAVRAARPAALCPWCKGCDAVGAGYVAACLGCGGQRWITAEQMAAAPPELKGAEAYVVDGQLYSFEEARAAWAARVLMTELSTNGHAKPKERRIRVTLPDGQEVPPPGDEDAPPDASEDWT